MDNTIIFTKMQGIGNDYVYIDCFKQKIEGDLNQMARKISDRHFGVGSDGLVLIMPSEKADFRMRMFNSDGSEAEMCGNAVRCVGKYVYEKGLTDKTAIDVETLAGIKAIELNIQNRLVESVKVDMGEPILEADGIPVISSKNGIVKEILEIQKDLVQITCVSMGNPHAVTFVDNVDGIVIERIGLEIENNEIFPKRTNAEFVKVINRELLEMRVWERGAGETLACGTGACAVLVAAVLNGLAERKSVVRLRGGDLLIEWKEENNRVYMTGAAEFVFEGEITP
ncbi:MAG: diaminopimelate epimerase [Deltaproteobacteria bacterium]